MALAGNGRAEFELQKWARFGFTGLLALLALSVLRADEPYIPLLSDIDVAMHEFGHYLFIPFGETMTILGGSLWQVLFPLIFAAYFSASYRTRKRDVFAAMACLWWAALNLLEVAVYVNDSRALDLTLLNGLTGKESDAHDWNNLLTQWHALKSAHAIAATMRRIATVTFLVSIITMIVMTFRLRAATSGDPGQRSRR